MALTARNTNARMTDTGSAINGYVPANTSTRPVTNPTYKNSSGATVGGAGVKPATAKPSSPVGQYTDTGTGKATTLNPTYRGDKPANAQTGAEDYQSEQTALRDASYNPQRGAAEYQSEQTALRDAAKSPREGGIAGSGLDTGAGKGTPYSVPSSWSNPNSQFYDTTLGLRNPGGPGSKGSGLPNAAVDGAAAGVAAGVTTAGEGFDGSDGSGSGKGNGGKGGGKGGGGGWYGGGGSGSTTPANYPTDEELLAQALGQAGVGVGGGAGVGGGTNVSGTLGGSTAPYEMPEMPGANPERLEHVDTTELRNMLQQIVDAQKEQSQNTVDYNVQRETEALNRAMEDAAPQFQTQRDQVAADEMNALDNQALYAEARGDRGGIGEAQYASIQAAANQNRRAVNDAQVKLSTDTARQISDLRAQGEFEKADQLLSLTQSYLSQLMNLEQWALQENMSVDQFNSQLQKWVDEYNLNVQQYLTDLDLSQANLTGVFANGNATRATQNQLIETLANAGTALLNAGVLPSQQQLNAMGMTPTQAKAYIAKLQK